MNWKELYALVNENIKNAVSGLYKPAGDVTFAELPELSQSVLGYTYTVTNAFTTDSRFTDYDTETQTGHSFPADTEVAVIVTGTTENPVYMFNVMGGIMDGYATKGDLDNYVEKEAGKSLSANDYTDADKTLVQNSPITVTATGAEITASTAQGNLNKLTVYGKSEVVDGAIVSAGDSGSIEIETCQKNLLDPTKLVTENITYTDGTLSGTAANFFLAYNQGIPILFNTTKQITLSLTAYKSGTFDEGLGLVVKINYTDKTTDRLGIPNNTTTPQSFTLTSNPTKQIQDIAISYGDGSANIWYLSEIQLEYGSTATAYEPYNGTMAVFETGTPLRGITGGARDVMAWNGSAGTVAKKCGEVDLGTLTWNYDTTYQLFYATITERKIGNLNILCDRYPITSASYADMPDKSCRGSFQNTNIYIRDTDYNSTADFTTAMNGVKLVYELATPTTEQLTVSENASISGLRTFQPQTHAQNNAGATMTVEAYAGTANGKAVSELKQDVQSEISALKITQSDTLTLTTAGWSNNAQTVTYAHDTAKRNVIDVDPSSVEEWASCGVLATAETASGITFTCKTVPENALNFKVTSMGVN